MPPKREDMDKGDPSSADRADQRPPQVNPLRRTRLYYLFSKLTGRFEPALRDANDDSRLSTVRVCAEVPGWVPTNEAASVVAEVIAALSDLHIAEGGAGLVVDGFEADVPTAYV